MGGYLLSCGGEIIEVMMRENDFIGRGAEVSEEGNDRVVEVSAGACNGERRVKVT